MRGCSSLSPGSMGAVRPRWRGWPGSSSETDLWPLLYYLKCYQKNSGLILTMRSRTDSVHGLQGTPANMTTVRVQYTGTGTVYNIHTSTWKHSVRLCRIFVLTKSYLTFSLYRVKYTENSVGLWICTHKAKMIIYIRGQGSVTNPCTLYCTLYKLHFDSLCTYKKNV